MWFIVAGFALLLAIIVGLVNGKGHIYEKVFGIYIAVGQWFGNCFSPAIVFEWRNGCLATLTIRTKGFTETRINWFGWFKFNWNSEHIAKRWGKWNESCNGWLVYNGWLGQHIYC